MLLLSLLLVVVVVVGGGGGLAYQNVKPLMPGTVSRVEFLTQVKLPNLGTFRPLPMRSTSSM